MFDSVPHVADYLNPLFAGLNGAVRDDFLKIIAIAAWTKALTAIGAAYMKRMIPLRTTLEPGAVFGEMALFTAAGRRTASAVCVGDVRLLVITYEQFEQLYFQNPEFGLYLVRLIVRRFEMNHVQSNCSGISATG
jgi:CRP-like cAMP-binding protein